MGGHGNIGTITHRIIRSPQRGSSLILCPELHPPLKTSTQPKKKSVHRSHLSQRRRKEDEQFAIERVASQDAPLVPTPGKHRKRDRHGHVDPNLPRLNLLLKPPRSRPVPRKDRRTIPICITINKPNHRLLGKMGTMCASYVENLHCTFVSVDQFDRFIEVGNIHHRQHRSKDFFSIFGYSNKKDKDQHVRRVL